MGMSPGSRPAVTVILRESRHKHLAMQQTTVDACEAQADVHATVSMGYKTAWLTPGLLTCQQNKK